MMSALASLRKGEGLANELIRAVIGSAGVRFAGMIVTFLVGVQLARYLGPEAYGVYGMAMAMAAILIVFAQLGLPQLITREISGAMAKGDFSRAKGAMIWFPVSVAGASLFMMLVGYLGISLWEGKGEGQLGVALYWALALVPLFALTNIFASALRGFHKVVRAQIFDAVLRPLLFAGMLFAAFVMLGSISPQTALMFHVAAATIILLICAITLFLTLPDNVRSTLPTLHARTWVSSAVPMTGTEIVRTIDGQYAVLLLGMLVSAHDVGIFRVALATAAFLSVPGTVLTLVIMPYIAKFHAAEETQHLQKLATMSALVSFASTATMTAVIVFFGQSLIKIVFGNDFVSAWPPLVLISIAFTIQGFFGSSATILNMASEEKAVTFAYSVSLMMAVCLSWILIPAYGPLGVGVAMIISEIIKDVIMWRRAHDQLKIDTSLAAIFLKL